MRREMETMRHSLFDLTGGFARFWSAGQAIKHNPQAIEMRRQGTSLRRIRGVAPGI